MCTHTKDTSWTTDLIWHYLHETTSAAPPVGGWYKQMDPQNTLSDRHHVYEMLVDSLEHSDPLAHEIRGSMIPWNQRNAGMMAAFKTELACGSVVKIAFMRYMDWGGSETPSRDVNSKKFDAADWIVKSLYANRPVRAYLKKKNHYVGIVGHRGTAGSIELLIMDPWPGGASTGATQLDYGGGKTKFLGVATQNGKFFDYDGVQITAVNGPHPW